MIKNQLLACQSPALLTALEGRLSPQRLFVGQVLRQRGDKVSDIYFIEEGVVSLLSEDDAHGVETCLIGPEGMIGASALLGAAYAPSTSVVRIAGLAWRLSRHDFEDVLARNPAFRQRVMAYLTQRLRDGERAIVAAARCTIEERVARWLLMAHDRVESDAFMLTHDCLARTLGVRRPGVTVALHLLEGKHAIKAQRGRIWICSRSELERIAGIAYRQPAPVDAPPAPRLAA